MNYQTRILLILTLFILSHNQIISQVAINSDGNNPDNSAMLDIESTSKGLLIPRVTTAEMLAIVDPANSLLVFNTEELAIYFYDQTYTTWIRIVSVNNNPRISDSDFDTYFTVEENLDDDTARLFIAGTEKLKIGSKSLEQVNNGNSVFIGEGAGKADDLSANQNVFVGYYTGTDNTIGENNVGIGANTLFSNTTGVGNTAAGGGALSDYLNGLYNVAIGFGTLASNSTGHYNTAIGTSALSTSISGGYNTAAGTRALMANTFGEYNCAFGNKTLNENTSVGSLSLHSNGSASPFLSKMVKISCANGSL